MATFPANISVTAPVGQAIDRVKRMLFQPFHARKWFTIGFCAWLAGLGELGNNFNANYHQGESGPPAKPVSFRETVDHGMHYAAENLYWILPAVAALAIMSLACGMLLAWVNSRGKFMFLHCVALDRGEVKRPWREFVHEGNSLFWFRFLMGLLGIILTAPPFLAAVLLIGRMAYLGHPEAGGIVLAILLGGSSIFLIALFCLILKFTKDFVVPIMFLRRTQCTTAWEEFLGMLGANLGNFTLYVLFQIVLLMAVGFVLLFAVVATCCIAGCLMALPYLGTVVLLPVIIFMRSYSLYYLAQYGPAYSVFPPEPAVKAEVSG
jgi:hypothetical protein